jgi:hypothetical protein
MAFKPQVIEEMGQASRIFTDREEPRKAFWNVYKRFRENIISEKQNDIAILTFYGIGGIGKSTLLNKLQDEMDVYKSKQDKKSLVPYVYYDMKTDTSKMAILTGLRKILMKNYGFTFPVFDLAINVYLLKIGRNIITKEQEGFISDNQYAAVATDIAGAGIDLLGIIPLAGPAVSGGIKIIDTLIAYHRNKDAHRKIELSKLQSDSPEEILNNLQINFAKDLADNLKDAKYPLVVFFDTYELLVNELASVGEPLMNDKWLRDLKNGLVTHTPNTIWVFAGRESIKWGHINPEWDENIEQHLIGTLSEADAKQFLSESGITDPDIQAQINQITKGIPVYLDICVNNFFYLKEIGKEPSKELLGKDEKELLERFMRYTDDSKKDMIYLLSCLDEWTEEELHRIGTEILGSVSVSAIKRVKGYSFIESSDGINFSMHQLVREVLYENCDVLIRKKVDDYFERTLKVQLDQTEAYSGNYLKLLKKYIQTRINNKNDETNFEQVYDQISNTYISALLNTYQYEGACKAMELFINQIHERTLLAAKMYIGYSYCLCTAGKYSNAVYYAEKAYEIYKEQLADSSILRVDALFAMAAAYHYAGRIKESLELSEEVLNLRKKILGEEHPDTIKAMNDLSIDYRTAGRFQEALDLSEKVLDLNRRILGEEHPDTISSMYNLSCRYHDVGQIREALDLSEKVLYLRKRILGEEHLDTISAMNSLSANYSMAGRFQEALALSEIVFELRMRILGEEHPDTLEAMYNLSNGYSRAGRFQEALVLSEKVFELSMKILGEEHPITIKAMSNLSIGYGKTGQIQEALVLSEKVLEMSMKILGEEHPDTIDAIKLYNDIKSDVENYYEDR